MQKPQMVLGQGAFLLRLVLSAVQENIDQTQVNRFLTIIKTFIKKNQPSLYKQLEDDPSDRQSQIDVEVRQEDVGQAHMFSKVSESEKQDEIQKLRKQISLLKQQVDSFMKKDPMLTTQKLQMITKI